MSVSHVHEEILSLDGVGAGGKVCFAQSPIGSKSDPNTLFSARFLLSQTHLFLKRCKTRDAANYGGQLCADSMQLGSGFQ